MQTSETQEASLLPAFTQYVQMGEQEGTQPDRDGTSGSPSFALKTP